MSRLSIGAFVATLIVAGCSESYTTCDAVGELQGAADAFEESWEILDTADWTDRSVRADTLSQLAERLVSTAEDWERIRLEILRNQSVDPAAMEVLAVHAEAQTMLTGSIASYLATPPYRLTRLDRVPAPGLILEEWADSLSEAETQRLQAATATRDERLIGVVYEECVESEEGRGTKDGIRGK